MSSANSKSLQQQKLQTRSAFVRQPARVLLVDYQPPFDSDTCEYLHQSLVDFFSLVTHLTGPCRTPLFGLFALGKYPENLFQLQHVKGSLPRLHSALEDLKFFAKEKLPATSASDVLLQGLQDAVIQFKRQSQSLRQMTPSSCQLEITVLSCTKASQLSSKIEKISKELDLGSIKKIQIAAVVGNMEDDDSSTDQETSQTNDGGSMGCGLVDTIFLQKDLLSFQNFFKSWLIDCETDQEHLRITLPNPFHRDEGDLHDLSQDNRATEENLVLKCDIHERLLSPQFLPYRSQFEMNTEIAGPAPKFMPAGRATNISYPLHTLQVCQVIKASAICESVPYIVRPTVCWKLDWEELENNQQHFYALCSALQNRDQVLLLKTKTNPDVGYPVGHFLLLPSGSGSMLLKSIATNELVLPADVSQTSEAPLSEAVNAIAACLDQFEVEESFNPLMVSSNLYKCVVSNALKGISTSRPQKRRFQPPQQRFQQTTHLVTSVVPQPTKSRVLRAPSKRVVFNKDNGQSKSGVNKRQRTAALDIYVTSPPDFPDDL